MLGMLLSLHSFPASARLVVSLPSGSSYFNLVFCFLARDACHFALAATVTPTFCFDNCVITGPSPFATMRLPVRGLKPFKKHHSGSDITQSGCVGMAAAAGDGGFVGRFLDRPDSCSVDIGKRPSNSPTAKLRLGELPGSLLIFGVLAVGLMGLMGFAFGSRRSRMARTLPRPL
jgi:hypothetical protein